MGSVILLDTNVISEVMQHPSERHPAITRFIDHLPLSDLFIPSIVAAEIFFGLQKLPFGRKRSDLERKFQALLAGGFRERVAVCDLACAAAYAEVRAARQRAGRPVSVQDALIGGMALANGAVLATRNISDFDGYGLTLINPWTAS